MAKTKKSAVETMSKFMKSEEVSKILELVKNKKSIKDIAASQKKTTHYIKSKLKNVACEYYLNSNKPFNEIQQITGIKKEEIIISRPNVNESVVNVSQPKVESASKEPEVRLVPEVRPQDTQVSIVCVDIILPALDTFIEYTTYLRSILKSIR